jgi:predicted DNA-binding transcriptional regulator AlpA
MYCIIDRLYSGNEQMLIEDAIDSGELYDYPVYYKGQGDPEAEPWYQIDCEYVLEYDGMEETAVLGEMGRIYSVEEVGKMLGLSKSTLYRHYRRYGGVKIGGRVMFAEKYLQQAIEDARSKGDGRD